VHLEAVAKCQSEAILRLAERGSHWPRSSSWLGLQGEPWIAQCRRAKQVTADLFSPGEWDRDFDFISTIPILC
jgi:hypothetical protein